MMRAMPTTHLLYLHGFRSSPQSTKAQLMAARVARDHPGVHWWCPQLPLSPRASMALVSEGIAHWPSGGTAVVGSSLGGFYATWLAERLRCKAALLNPAVFPTRDLAAHIDELTSWHDPAQAFIFEPSFIAELEDLQCAGPVEPSNYYALVAKGDEVLDWREMIARYSGATVRLLEGSNHALSDFAAHIDAVLAFLDLAPPAQPNAQNRR